MKLFNRLFFCSLMAACLVIPSSSLGWSISGLPAASDKAIRGGSLPAHPMQTSAPFVPGELMVKFSALERHKSSRLVIEAAGGQLVREFPSIGWQQVKLPAGTDVLKAMAQYQQLRGIEAAQPNYIYQTLATSNDPRLGDLYGLDKIQAPVAWDRNTGSSNVIVAVIDTGVLYSHEDLSANMWRNPGETGLDANGIGRSSNGVDDDRNGYVDDVFGVDTINDDSNPIDDNGHGTHVAGTIGAVGNNSKGVVGVNWNVRLMAIKTHNAGGDGSSASVVEGFQYAAMMRKRGVNVRVTNSSWGGAPEAPAYDQTLKDAIDAAGKAGILNVCAAGNSVNDNDATPFYPATYNSPSIISVAASNRNDGPASFTSYGYTSVDLAAPGVDILSTGSGATSYRSLSGTSMAAPHVSGAAALLCAYRGALSRSELKATLMNTATPLAQWSFLTVTGGRLNVNAAELSLPNDQPLDTAQVFVTEQYRDFLNREPDPGGLTYWTNEITKCGADIQCVNRRRIEVAASFFIEQEFQDTGSFVYRMYRASFARQPTYSEFMPDRISIIGGPNLANDKITFANNWVQRPAFLQVYPNNLAAVDFVNRLFDSAGLTPYAAERQQQITTMTSAGKTRARVLQDVIEIAEFKTREYNPSVVLMEYFGYLKRDPDPDGYNFWLNVVTDRAPNNYLAMVCAFITSREYQERFSLVVTHNNGECGP
ncbi:MAG: S8 family serine peptidase [Pyrinomonadaceae bacterium]